MPKPFLLRGKRKGPRQSTWKWLRGLSEAIFALTLILVGVVLIAVATTLQIQFSTEKDPFFSTWVLIVQLVIAIALLVLGSHRIAMMFIKVGFSVERRRAIVPQIADPDQTRPNVRAEIKLPTVPLAIDAISHTGQSLKYRLVSSQSSVVPLTIMGSISVAFVSVAAVVAVLAIHSIGTARFDWVAIVLFAAFLPASIWSIYHFVFRFLMLTGIGPTRLEISDLPLVAGRDYQVAISQPGRLRFKSVMVFLECFEKTTFRQGTDIRDEVRVVSNDLLFRKRGVDVVPGSPFRSEFALELAPDIMHSFRSPSNQISWRLIVEIQARKWPTIRKTFPIVIIPAPASVAA